MIYTIAIILILIFGLSYSQEDVTTLEDSTLTTLMRPAVSFNHDEHNEKANIVECNVCHHVYENGLKSEDSSSEDMECSECHASKKVDDVVPLIDVYHKRCKSCHIEQKAGPVMCSECHRK
ncbi:MAG: cytochrome c3 family protein [Desulfobacterales bacterium]|nr:cytochrome c3 family protein [Desulfobacterales bacterium]